MTEINNEDTKGDMMEDGRIKRRRLLKMGAAIAPLAVTLHGGVAFAQVNSAARCVENLKARLVSEGKEIPVFEPDQNGNYVSTNHTIPFDESLTATTGRLNANNNLENHWEYLESQDEQVQSCMQSFFGNTHQ